MDWHALLNLLLEKLWELPLLICAVINVQPGLVLEVQRLPEHLRTYMQWLRSASGVMNWSAQQPNRPLQSTVCHQHPSTLCSVHPHMNICCNACPSDTR